MGAGNERILYEGRSTLSGMWICVTTRWCLVNDQRYPVAELTLIGTARGQRDLFRVRKSVGLALVTVVMVLSIVAIGSGRTRQIWAALAVTAAATVAITALPSVLSRFMRRPFQIWGNYRGAPVLLFDTSDSEQYGQVARALIRARELLD